ncbi:MAG: GAK system ATP-grasp enzyme [Phycisphaerae bacterium]|nr:GAK system ATP-grasp enzyme [Phycisphaerae bacterium]
MDARSSAGKGVNRVEAEPPSIAVIGLPGGWSTKMLVEAFKRCGCETALWDARGLTLDLDQGRVWGGAERILVDAVVLKKIGRTYAPRMLDRLSVLNWLAQRGTPIFSRPANLKRVLDRLSCTVELSLADIPMPPTVVTEDIDAAVRAVETFGRAVLKPVYTSKARGMRVVDSGLAARSAIEEFRDEGHALVYVQKLLKLPGRDLGLVFCGGRYLGSYARVGKADSWNTTTASGGKYARAEPGDDIVALAHKAQAVFGLDFTCVDIAESEIGPVVFEVSAFGGFRGLWEAEGVNAADAYARHVLSRISREQ